MPKFRKVTVRNPPKGYDEIQPTLLELNNRLREVNNTHENKNKESIWEIIRIHHQISRYVYELYHFKKQISKDIYDFCLEEKQIDKNLISKWKKPGYERLCCLSCVQKSNQNYGTTCICRVPKKDLNKDIIIECKHCGCKGCVTYDLEKD